MNALRAVILILSSLLLLALVLPVSGQTGIIVNNADSMRTVDTVPSSNLNNLLGGVQVRIVAQFSNNLRTLSLLNQPAPLQTLLSGVAQRVIAQYANSVRHANLVALSDAFQTLVANVVARVVVQFANNNRQLPMAYPRTLLNDTVIPVISEFQNGVDVQGTKVQWNTDEFTRCTLRYGTQPSTYTAVIENALYAMQHAVILNNLTGGVTYYLQVSCTDQSNNATTSNEFSFTIGVLPPAKNLWLSVIKGK